MNATLTLEEFRATGHDVADLREALEDSGQFDGADGPMPGRVYAGDCYIEENAGPQGKYHETQPYFCTIANDSRGGTLQEMEAFLYECWYASESAS